MARKVKKSGRRHPGTAIKPLRSDTVTLRSGALLSVASCAHDNSGLAEASGTVNATLPGLRRPMT
jgi:hypothetical protein